MTRVPERPVRRRDAALAEAVFSIDRARTDGPPQLYATSTKLQGFVVNPGGAYGLESVWLT